MKRLMMLLRPPGGISCARVHKLVQSYLDGELSGRDRDRLAAHLHRCEPCGVEAETYEHIKAALVTEPSPEAVGRLERFATDLMEAPPER